MNLPIYQVDAFTDQIFKGNPAAIVPMESWLPDDKMQSIAAENNLAETAFFVSNGPDYDLRWFTPTLEIDLCGHATLASAHVLFHHLGYAGKTINFHTRSGVLPVSREENRYVMDFPSRPPEPTDRIELLAEALGKRPMEVLKSRDYLVRFDSETDVRALKPDYVKVSQLDAIGVIATAPGDSVDFVSRFFAPQAGVPEDPVTGSAHCTLVPYWASKLGKTQFRAWQVSPRSGDLYCQLKDDRVIMAGHAITYLIGQIDV